MENSPKDSEQEKASWSNLSTEVKEQIIDEALGKSTLIEALRDRLHFLSEDDLDKYDLFQEYPSKRDPKDIDKQAISIADREGSKTRSEYYKRLREREEKKLGKFLKNYITKNRNFEDFEKLIQLSCDHLDEFSAPSQERILGEAVQLYGEAYDKVRLFRSLEKAYNNGFLTPDCLDDLDPYFQEEKGSWEVPGIEGGTIRQLTTPAVPTTSDMEAWLDNEAKQLGIERQCNRPER